MSLDCAVDEVSCGNNHVVAYNESLNKIFLWGSNGQGQIDVFKKEQMYKKPKALSFGAHVSNFKVVARGDVCVFFCDEELSKADLEMHRVPREDILNTIHELGSKADQRSTACGTGASKK